MRVFTMRLATLISLSIVGALVNGSGALAQPGHGSLGAQSRAEVRISVSVAPRFQAKTVSKVKDAHKDVEEIAFRAINAPGLRYSLVRLRQEKEQSLGSGQTAKASVLLVVPE